MIKYFILLINILGIFILNLFLADISINMNVPAQVEAGSDFTVEMTISKGELESFARFQQDLPIGLTATEGKTANGQFSFKNQKVKILWLKLPSDAEFTISYKIHVDKTVTGPLTLGGQFSFIEEEDRRTVDIDPKTITVTGTVIADVTDTGTDIDVTDISTEVAGEVTCSRKKTINASKYEVIVKVNVNKYANNQFAKIQEEIPQGYIATNIESKGGIFTFKNQVVKYLWMNLPSESAFTVSYKLTLDESSNITKNTISGSFSYLKNDQTFTVDTKDDGVKLPGFGQVIAGTTTDTKDDGTSDQKYIYTDNYTDDIQVTGIPGPEKGVSYSIQICALKKYRNPNYFRRKKYNLKDDIRSEAHEGWNKYIVGSFPVYKSARDHRIYIWNSTPINDAFVSAYNDGNRITVQEALMIANQKWYK